MPRKPLALAAVLALALIAPTAHAAIVPGQVIDGPSADVQRFGDLDIAPDGTGALAYVKKVGGNDNIFVSLFNGSTWGPGQRVSNDTICPAAAVCLDPHVAAGNGGRVVVTFRSENTNLSAALKPNGSSPFALGSPAPGSNGVVDGSDVDMDPASGVAYAVIDTAGGNVRASRLSGTTWTEIGGAAHNLDGANNDTGNASGGSQNTARVAVDTSGNAVVAWPGQDAGAKHQVFALRINGTATPSPSVTMSVPSLAGKTADGNNVDMINMDGGGSPNPWIAFREQFTYGGTGRPRDLITQLVGNSASPAQVVDGLPLDNPDEGAENPRLDVNPAGQGLANMPRQLFFNTMASSLSGGVWSPGFRVDSGTPTGASFPNAAIADDGRGLLTWEDTTGATTSVLSRTYVAGVLGPNVTLSRNGDGQILTALDWPVGLSTSGPGTVAFAFGQGNGTTTNEIVAGVVDLPTGSGPPPPPKDTTAPTISALKLSRTTFALGTKLATITKKKRKTRVGTTISFNVSEQSSTTFTFAKRTRGYKAGRRCVAKRPKGKRKVKRCTRFVTVRPSLVFSTAAGTHKVNFQGRLSRTRKLKPGSYRLSVRSVDAAGNRSKAKTASFRLKRK